MLMNLSYSGCDSENWNEATALWKKKGEGGGVRSSIDTQTSHKEKNQTMEKVMVERFR